MDYQGEVKLITDLEYITDKFSKRTLVLTDNNDKYPSHIPIEFGNDSAELLLDLRVGDTVKATFFMNGREWNGRHFLSLKGNTVDVVSKANPGSQEIPSTFSSVEENAAAIEASDKKRLDALKGNMDFDDDNQDLPFN